MTKTYFECYGNVSFVLDIKSKIKVVALSTAIGNVSFVLGFATAFKNFT
jgi:hypothetical protein